MKTDYISIDKRKKINKNISYQQVSFKLWKITKWKRDRHFKW